LKQFTLLRWFVGAAILGLVLIRLEPSDFGDAITSVDLSAFVGATLLNVPILLLATLRSRLVLARMNHSVELRLLLASVTLGFAAGSLTPGASGEVLRADALNVRAGIGLRDGLTLVVFERGMSFYLMTLAGLAATALILLPLIPAAGAMVLIFVLAALPLILGPLLRLLPAQDENAGSLLQKVLYLLRGLPARLGDVAEDRWIVGVWSALTLAMFFIIAAQFWLLAEGLGGGLSLIEALIAFAASQVAAIISLIPLGLGAMDGTIAGVSSRSGMSDDDALALAILVRMASTLPLVAAATVSYFYLALRRPHVAAESGSVGKAQIADTSPIEET
jgi:uncharacterized protein (TIRG00374 family)